jgi:hypothetical protein
MLSGEVTRVQRDHASGLQIEKIRGGKEKGTRKRIKEKNREESKLT